MISVVKEGGRYFFFAFVLLLLLIDRAPHLSHASPSAVSPPLSMAVYWFLRGRGVREDPLAARSRLMWMRGTGKSLSSGHLIWITLVVAHTNEPTVWTMALLLSYFTQDWSCGCHCLVISLATVWPPHSLPRFLPRHGACWDVSRSSSGLAPLSEDQDVTIDCWGMYPFIG